MGTQKYCELYLQEPNSTPSENMGEKSSSASSRGKEKRGHFELSQSTLLSLKSLSAGETS